MIEAHPICRSHSYTEDMMPIHAGRTSIKSLVGVPESQLRVPSFQRPYSWGDEQVDELWSDIVEALRQRHGHFMGSIVLSAIEDGDDNDKVSQVIDGQQRLTTLLLLLSLVRNKWMELKPAMMGRPQQYLVSAHVDGEARFKFRSGDANWPVFRRYVLEEPGSGDYRPWERFEQLEDSNTRARNRPLYENALRLRQRLDEWLGGGDDRLSKLERIEHAVVSDLEFVTIRVPTVADAFIIFETLNDRGLALSAGDLLKNHVLHRAAQDGQDVEEMAEQWDDMLSLLNEADVTRFLRHYLLIKHARVQKDDVFRLFKDEVAREGARRLLDELLMMARWYGQFVKPASTEAPDTQAVLQDLDTLHASMCYSALLAARRFPEAISEEAFVDLARLAEVLTFRYSTICSKDAKELERAYHRAARALWDSKGQDLLGARKILIDQMPSRDEFLASFQSQYMGRAYVVNYVLRRIEEAFDPDAEKSPNKSGYVHIEHILPQTPDESWLVVLGPRATEHPAFVNRWGNLTLLGGRRNIRASNYAFDRKKAIYTSSSFELTRRLTSVGQWDFDAIEQRQRDLALLADAAWPVK